MNRGLPESLLLKIAPATEWFPRPTWYCWLHWVVCQRFDMLYLAIGLKCSPWPNFPNSLSWKVILSFFYFCSSFRWLRWQRPIWRRGCRLPLRSEGHRTVQVPPAARQASSFFTFLHYRNVVEAPIWRDQSTKRLLIFISGPDLIKNSSVL